MQHHLLCCRQEAAAAASGLHTQVGVMKGRLAAEEASIASLRDGISAAAQQEAATLAQLQGQVRRRLTPCGPTPAPSHACLGVAIAAPLLPLSVPLWRLWHTHT